MGGIVIMVLLFCLAQTVMTLNKWWKDNKKIEQDKERELRRYRRNNS